MSTIRSLALAFAALLFGLTLPSCLVSSKTTVSQSGNYVSPQTIAQLQPGSSKEYVVALLGDPSSKTTLGDGTEIWRWRHREERNSSGHLFLVFSGENNQATERSAFVEFKDGVVSKAWSD